MATMEPLMLTALRARDPAALGRALTMVAADDILAGELLADLGPPERRAVRVGITGPPGVGKSCLVSALVARLRQRGATVAVLAVDPSSPFSGGAVLGDRVRMADHVLDAGVLIRSFGSQGVLGGVARGVAAAGTLLERVGFDWLVIETVGVGQSEIAIRDEVDSSVLVLSAGSGDGVQLIKGGILEIADVLVVNKADLAGADALARELARAASANAEGWTPPVVSAVAIENDGLQDTVDAIAAHRAFLATHDVLTARRRAAQARRITERLLDDVRARAARVLAGTGGESLLDDLHEGRTDPAAATAWLAAACSVRAPVNEEHDG
jgi:LAO/AO transport system kinase